MRHFYQNLMPDFNPQSCLLDKRNLQLFVTFCEPAGLLDFSPLVRGNASAMVSHHRFRQVVYRHFSPLVRGNASAIYKMRCCAKLQNHFSPLVRGNASAISFFLSPSYSLEEFQSPRSGQCLCNEAMNLHEQIKSLKFQSPRSGQCLCNPRKIL